MLAQAQIQNLLDPDFDITKAIIDEWARKTTHFFMSLVEKRPADLQDKLLYLHKRWGLE